MYLCYPVFSSKPMGPMDALNYSLRGIIKELNAILSGRVSRTDIRTVHHLRVVLKKYRAALGLANRIEGPKLQLPKSIIILFHAAGELRDIQVERQWMKNLPLAPAMQYRDVIRQLSREEKIRRERYRLALTRVVKPEWKQCCKDIQAVVGDLEAKPVRKWINKRYAVMVRRGRKLSGRRALHAWRRKSKRVYYQALLASAPAQHPLANRSMNALHTALQLAGDWHDSVVAGKHIRQLRQQWPPGSRDSLIDAEKTLIRAEKRLLKKTKEGIAALPGTDLIIT